MFRHTSSMLTAADARFLLDDSGAQAIAMADALAALAEALAKHDHKDHTWAEQVARTYAAARQRDVGRTSQVVDTLFRSLLSDFLPVQAMRAGGLWALKLSPALRDRAFQTGMGVQST